MTEETTNTEQNRVAADCPNERLVRREDLKMTTEQKLYKVTLRGMTYSSTGVVHGVSYVVANNPDHAHQVVKKDLEKREIGFRADREMASVELLAEDTQYPDCKTRLYA